MMRTRTLLSWTNGSQPIARITTDEQGNVVCPNNFPHGEHTNAVWTDWGSAGVWTCHGLPFATLDEDAA